MADSSNNHQVRSMKVVLLVSSLACVAVLVSAAYQENIHGEWRTLQHTYRGLLQKTAGDEVARRAAAAFAVEQKQLFLQEAGKIDRCVSCHLGVENPAMADAHGPFGQHSGDLLAQHSIDKFGCTICHQGQGRAMSKEAAHGWREDGSLYPHTEEPLQRGSAVYTSCGRCHGEVDLFGGEGDRLASGIDQSTLAAGLPGASALTEGKRLVIELGCLGCHKYRERGGVIGPDLTFVGDKSKHDFDFSHIKGEHSVEQWLFEHFMTPREVSPGTLMPDLGLSPDEARNLAMYMMGLHRKDAPASLRTCEEITISSHLPRMLEGYGFPA